NYRNAIGKATTQSFAPVVRVEDAVGVQKTERNVVVAHRDRHITSLYVHFQSCQSPANFSACIGGGRREDGVLGRLTGQRVLDITLLELFRARERGGVGRCLEIDAWR